MHRSRFDCRSAMAAVFALAMLFATTPQAATQTSKAPADFYVAPDGNDANPGTLDQPFATVQRAQRAVRESIANGSARDVQVALRGGTYYLAEQLTFTELDTSPGHRVIYAAYPDEQPVIRGGHVITGWTRGDGNRWTAPLPDGLRAFRDLYADGHRQARARFPNGSDVLRVTAVSEDVTAITLDTSLPGPDLAGRGAELVVLQNWSMSRVPVARSEGAVVIATVPAGWIGHGDATTTSPGKPAYLEHALEFLDRPGEWYLDAGAGIVYYLAAPGEDPNARVFIAPAVAQLLDFRGKSGAPVRGVTFRGIAFEYTAWSLPAFGYLGIQAGHHGTRTDAPTHVLPAAIELRHAEDCRFEQCRVAHTGASGIAFGAGSRNNAVIRSTLVDIGGNGVMIGLRDRGDISAQAANEDSFLAADWANPDDAPMNNEIANNEITRAAAVQFGAVGIADLFSKGTWIHHNHVWDLPYTGVSLGFRWDTTPTSQQAGRTEYNHIHDVMKLLADGGGIYTLGAQPGAVLRGNLIHDIHRSETAHGGAPNNGIFFDQGSSGIHVEDTIIYNTSGEPLRFNQTDKDQFTWGTNYLGVAPGDQGFPTEIAAKSEVQP